MVPRALLSLALERRLADRFVQEFCHQVFDALASAPRRRVSLPDGFLIIDPCAPRQELAGLLRNLRRAGELVISDSDLRVGYPRITAEMVRLAPLYAATYALRGRPRGRGAISLR